jgi:hypothetical protein
VEVSIWRHEGSEDLRQARDISVWDLKENADNYGRTAYAGVVKTLTSVIEGPRRVQTYDVSNSTFHKSVGPVTA